MLRQNQINDLKNNLKVCDKGHTSKSFTAPDIFVKYISNIESETHDVYRREKYIVELLQQFDWCPRFLYCDDNLKFFIFSNCGVAINLQNKPEDLKEQFEKILLDMESINVQHNDIKQEEILVKNKKIYLCDFGYASINYQLSCNIGLWDIKNYNKPGGYLDDKTTLSRLKLI